MRLFASLVLARGMAASFVPPAGARDQVAAPRDCSRLRQIDEIFRVHGFASQLMVVGDQAPDIE